MFTKDILFNVMSVETAGSMMFGVCWCGDVAASGFISSWLVRYFHKLPDLSTERCL